jgi:cyclohexadieny/prephenate dehydrogenase
MSGSAFKPFERLTIIGAGLIGSSIVHAAKAKAAAHHITVCDADTHVLRICEEIGLGDNLTDKAVDAAENADCVILCVPVGVYERIAKDISPVLKKGAIISDVGSVKGSVVRQMQPHLPDTVHFIPGHPVAGTEHSGPKAGFANLFQNRWCILTPPEDADNEAVERLKAFWQLIGADVELMTPEHHDLVLAVTSHLPHLIAYNIVGTADDLETVTQSEVIKFSAGGFRDFTRIAASDPTMWRDVFLHNREAVLEGLGRFSEDLAALQRAIRWGDGETLYTLFERTRSIRRSIVDLGQDTDAPDFGRQQETGSTSERKKDL